MKNYLYILCAFLLAFAGCTKDADVEPIAPAPDGNTQVVLTGFSGRGTRTGFGGAEDGAVPFLWSAGDYIWARNTRSEAIAEGGSQATFVFESLETADTYDVFYNLTGPAAATALIPAEQTQQAAGELNLGQNGDFGYATAQNGTFTLEHATSYVWFDTYSSDVTSNLLSITLSVSGGQTIAGEAAFADGKLGDCKGSSSVTLSFGEEVFREIPLRYDSLKTLAAKAERKPVVMLNTPYGDSWLMAPPSSYVARLIADAGGQYVYTQDTGNQSRPIDTEEAYLSLIHISEPTRH